MARKKVIFTIVAEQGYIHSTGATKEAEEAFSAQNDVLFSAISCTYLPLLEMLERFEAEGLPCRLALVLSAPVCTLLEDPRVQKQFIDALDKRLALGNCELERNAGNEAVLRQVRRDMNRMQKQRLDFTEAYSQRLVPRFRHFAKQGMLELVPTAATYAYLPHYADLPEALNAQVEIGLHANRAFFGETGEGFYLPYLGWAPELDAVLRSYGVNYTVVDTRALLFADTTSGGGIFRPVRTGRSLVLFAKNPALPDAISAPGGYRHRAVYRNQMRDIGFELDGGELSGFLGGGTARLQTGYKYWANGSGGDSRIPYDDEAADAQVRADAQDFYATECARLAEAAGYLDGADALCAYTVPAELLGQTWHEGVAWLEQVLRLVMQGGEAELSLYRDNLQEQFSLPKTVPYPCADSGNGFAEDLIDSTNSWMQRYVRKASERIIDLTDRFPSETGLKARLLNLGAREVLLAQSGDWPRMIHEGTLPEYAAEEFKKNIRSFTAVFDSLASNTVSTEWLTQLEKEHPLFPWINYRIFGHKR